MNGLTDLLYGFIIVVVGGTIGGMIGWTITNCIIYGPRSTFEFWGWLLKGGWHD